MLFATVTKFRARVRIIEILMHLQLWNIRLNNRNFAKHRRIPTLFLKNFNFQKVWTSAYNLTKINHALLDISHHFKYPAMTDIIKIKKSWIRSFLYEEAKSLPCIIKICIFYLEEFWWIACESYTTGSTRKNDITRQQSHKPYQNNSIINAWACLEVLE